MSRSPEGAARRREAWAAWRASEAGRAYFAAYNTRSRDKENDRKARWRQQNPDKEQAARQRAYRTWQLQHLPEEPLPQLYPELNRGIAIAFWEDELRMDLAQEQVLAILEGRDPTAAAREYKSRETNWHLHSQPLGEER